MLFQKIHTHYTTRKGLTQQDQFYLEGWRVASQDIKCSHLLRRAWVAIITALLLHKAAVICFVSFISLADCFGRLLSSQHFKVSKLHSDHIKKHKKHQEKKGGLKEKETRRWEDKLACKPCMQICTFSWLYKVSIKSMHKKLSGFEDKLLVYTPTQDRFKSKCSEEGARNFSCCCKGLVGFLGFGLVLFLKRKPFSTQCSRSFSLWGCSQTLCITAWKLLR